MEINFLCEAKPNYQKPKWLKIKKNETLIKNEDETFGYETKTPAEIISMKYVAFWAFALIYMICMRVENLVMKVMKPELLPREEHTSAV